MKILTILGTRPEIIRLPRIIGLLDKYSQHTLVHTGQNYDKNLNDIFFAELRLRKPDFVIDSKSETAMGQIGKILVGSEKIMAKLKPDRLLILGDTNSALTAIVAKRLGIKVFHMEAGNRCFDDRVPEEVNRRIIDHSSDILMPYTERSRANLIREGIAHEKIFVTGNPIGEVLNYFDSEIEGNEILSKLKLTARKYFLITLHREENVDNLERLAKFAKAFDQLARRYKMPIFWSVHPRTKKRLAGLKLKLNPLIYLSNPVGLFEFVKLEKNAYCVLSDSGTVQEECCLFQVPSVTLRDVTERPETIEAGSNLLVGDEPQEILNGVKMVVRNQVTWQVPREYLVKNVSLTVAKIVLSFIK